MLSVKDLTSGEKLLIERRRTGYNQADAATWYGVTEYRYKLWERDAPRGEGDKGPPAVTLGSLEFFEAAYLWRRRLGVTVRELAEAMHVSAWWLTRLESGQAPDDRLREFWTKISASEGKAVTRIKKLAAAARRAG